MIFFLFLLSLIVIQRIVSSSAEIPKIKLPEPPATDKLSSPQTTEYHLPTGLLNLSQAIEQNTPANTPAITPAITPATTPATSPRHDLNPAVKNTAQ